MFSVLSFVTQPDANLKPQSHLCLATDPAICPALGTCLGLHLERRCKSGSGSTGLVTPAPGGLRQEDQDSVKRQCSFLRDARDVTGLELIASPFNLIPKLQLRSDPHLKCEVGMGRRQPELKWLERPALE